MVDSVVNLLSLIGNTGCYPLIKNVSENAGALNSVAGCTIRQPILLRVYSVPPSALAQIDVPSSEITLMWALSKPVVRYLAGSVTVILSLVPSNARLRPLTSVPDVVVVCNSYLENAQLVNVKSPKPISNVDC